MSDAAAIAVVLGVLAACLALIAVAALKLAGDVNDLNRRILADWAEADAEWEAVTRRAIDGWTESGRIADGYRAIGLYWRERATSEESS